MFARAYMQGIGKCVNDHDGARALSWIDRYSFPLPMLGCEFRIFNWKTTRGRFEPFEMTGVRHTSADAGSIGVHDEPEYRVER